MEFCSKVMNIVFDLQNFIAIYEISKKVLQFTDFSHPQIQELASGQNYILKFQPFQALETFQLISNSMYEALK
jgi:hypothetical protein